MDLAQYLVDHGFALYGQGYWHLPTRVQGAGLPKDLGIDSKSAFKDLKVGTQKT